MGKRFFRLMTVLMTMFFIWGCTKDELRDEGFRLYYSDVIEIAQNITYRLEPTWYGGTPGDFRLTKVKCGDAIYIGEEFSIDAETGVITIAGAANTTAEDYYLSISCVVSGQTYSYPDLVTVYFTNGIPEGISVEPAEIGADISELEENSEAELQTAQVITEGEHIAITSYSIRNVKYEGTIVDNISSPLFAISETGEISFVKGGPFQLGVYTLDLKLSTRSYTEESNVGLFADAVTVRVISAPTALTYTPDTGLVEADGSTPYSSVTPVLTGTAEGISYGISAVRTSTGETSGVDRISIDSGTGVISFATGGSLTTGTVYSIDVTVSSAYTEDPVLFPDIFSITVVDKIPEIENFSYTALEKKRALGWTVSPDNGLSGAEYFSFTDPSADYTRYVSLDVLTGDLSIEKNNTLPVGQYSIFVTAHNSKAENDTQAVFELSVVNNPYYFTYFSYGNNLNLTETQTDGVSQFRVTSSEELSGLSGEILYSDIDQSIMGTSAITFSRSVKQRLSGTTVDSGTGKITFTDSSFDSSLSANQIGIVFITATTVDPDDSENTFSVTIPVCVDYSSPMTETATGKTVSMQWNPFVLRVNPATGGRGVTPVITGTTVENLAIDYRRTFNYYNIAGVRSDGSELESGTLSSTGNVFLQHLWDNYYGSGANYGAKLPVAYYNGLTAKSASDLAKSPCYVDNAAGVNQYSLYVNGGIWYDDGWADGVFVGQITFCTDGSNVSDAGETQRFYPVAIWLDKDF